MRDRPLSPTAHDFATPGFQAEHRRNRHETSRSHQNENPIYLINGLFYWGARKCCRNVTAVRYDRWARRVVRTESRQSRTRSADTREGTEGVCVNRPANLPINRPPPPKPA